ncbi:MAG: DUF6587 family protein [Luteimonas sp.]
MTVSLALQYVVIALAVLLSAWVVLNKQFPHATRRARVAIAVPMLRDGRPPWMRSLARRVAPALNGISNSACGGCDNCAPTAKS